MRTRIFNELELIYKEFLKAIDIEKNKADLPYQKLQLHDPEKWKKKLKLFLDRERLIDLNLPQLNGKIIQNKI